MSRLSSKSLDIFESPIPFKMILLNKMVLFLFILFVSFFILSGCSQTTKVAEINSPVIIPYLVRNPIEIITKEKTDVSEFYKRTITISGLSDKKVELSINKELELIYSKTLDGEIPPYRGVRKIVKDSSKLTSNTLDSSMSYNYNNVASILIYGNRNYDYSTYVGTMNAYNVDLNTGREITLKDIFADDVDYKSILNDYVLEILMKSNASEEDYFSMVGSGLKLVAPFKGIPDNQKFFLAQGGLILIFDYTNPEFETGLYAATVFITFQELNNTIAIADRFYNKNINIYQSDKSPVFEFVQTGNSSDIRKQNNEIIDNIYTSQSLSYSESIPKKAIQKAEELYLIDMNKLNELKILSETSTEELSNFEQYVWVNITGKYTTVSRNTNIYYNSKWKSDSANFCYDSMGKEITISEIFVPSFDYKSKIMTALRNAMKQMPSTPNYQAEDLYENIQFTIGISEVIFITKPVSFDSSSESPVYFALTFEEIGCENLMIFN